MGYDVGSWFAQKLRRPIVTMWFEELGVPSDHEDHSPWYDCPDGTNDLEGTPHD